MRFSFLRFSETLAWTAFGGDILFIEASKMPGKGTLKLTGKLGDVMKESAQAAFSYVRSNSKSMGIEQDFYKKFDLHIHVPAGAIPKDGPSAGVAMISAMVSLLTNTPIKNKLGMTGEISLRGNVLPIGGLKEKLLAAHRARIEKVLIPVENKKDLAEIPKNILNDLERLTSDKVDIKTLKEVGLIRSNSTSVKLLGTGEVTKPFVVSVDQISKSAKEKIIAAVGSITE